MFVVRSRRFDGALALAQGCLTAMLAFGALACFDSRTDGGSSRARGAWLPGGAHGLVRLDPHQEGRKRALTLERVLWGRRVDVYATEFGAETLVARDFVVPADLELATADWKLDRDALGGRDQLIVAHPASSVAFLDVLSLVDDRVERALDKTASPSELPPYTAVSRNATLVLCFDDWLDPHSLDGSSVRVEVNHAPWVVAPELDPRHGAFEREGSALSFHSTRILIDLAVAAAQAADPNLDAPYQPNLGVPEPQNGELADIVVRLATRGERVLCNASGARLAASDEALDDSSPGRDLTRSLSSRSGGENRGFLSSVTALRIVGREDVQVTRVSPLGGADFELDFGFATVQCAAPIAVRDVLLDANGVAAVAIAASSAPLNGVITGAKFRSPSGAAISLGAAQLRAKWDPALGAPPECFVEIGASTAQPPWRAVPTAATFTVHFNQPVDPASASAFDGLRVDDFSQTSVLRQPIVGKLLANSSWDALTFVPSVPLAHAQGAAESYAVSIVGGPLGLRAAGGGPLSPTNTTATVRVDPLATRVTSGGFSLRFSSFDEDVPVLNGVPAPFPTPEIRGQMLYDFAAQIVRARPVTHFSRIADSAQPIVSWMIPLGLPIPTPLVPLGAKSQQVWRYHDLGVALTDENTMNIDLEGLNWAPFHGIVQPDRFPEFQIAVAHSRFLPDEVMSTALLPEFPLSGLLATYDQNLADATNDPWSIVHSKALGYVIDPSESFLSATGTRMQPFPMNHGVPPDQFVHYTWRDTAIQALGAPNGAGADTERYQQIRSDGKTYYGPDRVPSIGLPLLMEFRCYPNATSLGSNGFQVALAINTSAAPFFRAFSAGGVDSSGQTVTVDPDQSPVATGGFSTSTGYPTFPRDNVFYFGQADFVVRVSRLHTIWFDTALASPNYFAPSVEALGLAQPAGTQVVVAFRGANSISNPPSLTNGASYINAQNLDFYGESRLAALGGQLANAFGVSYLSNDRTFKAKASAASGARFVQMRVSFISNDVTGSVPTLSAIGLPFEQ